MTNPKLVELLADRIAAEWADKGKIIEGGWHAYVAVSGLDKAPELQRTEMRRAYMLGAQHLFASILAVLDPGTEPSQRD
jgi:hypothetical protein